MRILSTITGSAMIVAGAAAAPAHAQDDVLRMATIAPGLTPAIKMATFANIATDKVDGPEIEVSAGGAATLHMMELARGNLDFVMTNPVVFSRRANRRAMYANEPEAPELSENVQHLMLCPYGQYRFAARADSDIQLPDDLDGASIFPGPQGGGACNPVRGWIEFDNRPCGGRRL